MNAARKSRRRANWPRGMYEPREGYFVWRHPETGETYPIGRVSVSEAIHQAIEANTVAGDGKPTLAQRLTGTHRKVADVLPEMPTPTTAATRKAYEVWDRVIVRGLLDRDDRVLVPGVGSKAWAGLTVSDCADLVEGIARTGRATTAKQVRTRLVMLCKRAQQLGWLDLGANPALVTATPAVTVARERLTLEMFREIYDAAPSVNGWLQRAMMLGLVTGQDRSTICAMEREHVQGGVLTVWRSKTRKTNQPVAIPTSLRLEVVGVTLAELLEPHPHIRSRWVLHHLAPCGLTVPGDGIRPDTVSAAFAAARKLAGIDGENPPTFHELRSLAKRLYTAQGNVDTMALLGHVTERAAAIYADPRGIEPIFVRVTEQGVNGE